MTEIFNRIINIILKKGNKTNNKHKINKLYFLLKSFEEKLDRFFNKLSMAKGFKHQLCTHRYNCLIHTLLVSNRFLKSIMCLHVICYFTLFFKGFMQRFIGGYLIQAGIKLATSAMIIIKKPKIIKNILASSTNIELGLFFGFYNLIYRVINSIIFIIHT